MERSEYRRLLTPLLRFFYLQRCGVPVNDTVYNRFSHASCHTASARVYGTEEWINVSGGWHDAGDYGRYVVPGAKAVADLLLAYRACPKLFGDDAGIPESGNGVPDILDEARYELTWMLSMQRLDGAVYHKVSCAHFCGFIMPDAERETLVVSPVSTAATGDFAGAAALAYISFLPFDEAFASKCLAAAERAYAFLQNSKPIPFHNPPGIDTGEYDDMCDTDERFFAAAALHAATGLETYGVEALRLLTAGVSPSLGWTDVGGYGFLCLYDCTTVFAKLREFAKAQLMHEAMRLFDYASRDAYGLSLDGGFLWGSNMYLMNNAVLLLTAYRICGDERFLAAAKRHLDYILGDNTLAVCYVTGICAASARDPHHRPSVAAGSAMPGMLVGGPDAGLHDPCAQRCLAGREPIACYIDDRESFSTNEVAIYWNSPLIYVLALLYAS